MDINKLKQEINNLELLSIDIAYLIEITRDSCRNNEFFAQELILNIALDKYKNFEDYMDKVSNIIYAEL